MATESGGGVGERGWKAARVEIRFSWDRKQWENYGTRRLYISYFQGWMADRPFEWCVHRGTGSTVPHTHAVTPCPSIPRLTQEFIFSYTHRASVLTLTTRPTLVSTSCKGVHKGEKWGAETHIELYVGVSFALVSTSCKMVHAFSLVKKFRRRTRGKTLRTGGGGMSATAVIYHKIDQLT